MGLFGDIGRGAAGLATGGLSELARKDPFGLGGGGGGAGMPARREPMTAAGVAVSPALTAILGQQGKGSQNSINDVYNRIRSRYAADNTTRGIAPAGPGDAGLERIGAAETQSNAGLKSALESVLGNTAYSDAKAQRDFGQSYDLANMVGSLNKPSTLEEVLGGLSGAAGIGGQLYGLGKSKRMPSSTPSYSSPISGDPSLSLYDGSGYGRYY